MKITQVVCQILRIPNIIAKTASSQDSVLVRVRTDDGLEGVGEADSSPEGVKALVDAPFSHNIACGLRQLLIDIRKMNRVLHLDRDRGVLEVKAGIEWPDLIDGYLALQDGNAQPWGIAQKQTGADRLTVSGTIAANAHGRGLKMKPFINDVESFVLVDSSGNARNCSRTENFELFRLAPEKKHGQILLKGFEEAFKGRSSTGLPGTRPRAIGQ